MSRYYPHMTLEILVVEDNEGDVTLIRHCLNLTNVKYNFHVVADAATALAFLRRQGVYSDAVRPDLILLDLQLPGEDGWKILQEVKTDENLKVVPVIVLTSSESEEDILQAYNLHANCYICKPFDYEETCRMMNAVVSFWFEQVVLPPHRG